MGNMYVFIFWSDLGELPRVWLCTREQADEWAQEAKKTSSVLHPMYGPEARVPVIRWAIAQVLEEHENH